MTRPKSGNAINTCTMFGKTASRLLLLSSYLLLPFTTQAQKVHELVSTYEGGWIQDGVMFDVQTIKTNSSSIPSSGTTTPNGVTIHGLNVLTPQTEEFCLELYTKSGSFSSSPTSASTPSDWTFLGSFSLLGRGVSAPTPIPLGAFDPITIGVGETQAFYVTTQNEKLRYTALDVESSVTGDVYASSEPHYGIAMERISIGEGKASEIADSGLKKGTRMRGADRGKKNRQRGQNVTDESDGSRTLEESSGEGLSLQILTGVAKNYPFAESWPHRVFNGALLYTVGSDSDPNLDEQQRQEAWDAKRGMVTCDVDAVKIESYPSASPSDVKTPTVSPTKVTAAPSSSPTKLPTSSPSVPPTTLESTIGKVATTLHGGLKQAGFMFDIRVPTVEEGGPPEGITVIAFETSTFLTEDVCIEVYSKKGTYEGYEDDVIQADDGSWSSPSWGILGATTLPGMGEKEPTQLPIGSLDPVHVKPGERQAFYVTMTQPEMRYTKPKYDEKSGTVFSTSPKGHMEIMVGSAISYPFEEVWKDRIYNGAVIYALGDVADGKFGELNAEDRGRSCPRPVVDVVETVGPSKGPTSAPVAVAGGDGDVDVDATPEEDVVDGTPADEDTSTDEDEGSSSNVVNATITSSPTKNPTSSPTFGMTSTQDDPEVDMTARLSGNCPTAVVTVDSSTKNVMVPYEYSVITESGSDTNVIVQEMENVLHRSLMSDKCASERRRRLEDTIAYQGFNSNPSDQVSNTKGCDDAVTLEDGQECHLVSGGVTAVVASDADDEAVMMDVGSFVESVLEDPASYEGLGVSQVAVTDGSDDGSTTEDNINEDGAAEDGTAEDGLTEDGANQDLTIGGAKGGNQDPINDDSSTSAPSGLSTTGIIIIAALAGTLALALAAFVAMRVRYKRRLSRSDSEVLFNEFPDEEQRAYGGYDQSFAPLGTKTTKLTSPPPPPSPPPRTRSSSRSSAGPVVILNEVDDISLFSNDKALGTTGSVGSWGSKGSRGSKKSVEFVRAGQSFSSRQSNQPEDTVDL